MKKCKRIFPHITLILSLMVLTFFVIDRFNEFMAFMTSELSKWVIAALALSALVTSIRLILVDNGVRGSYHRQEAVQAAAEEAVEPAEPIEPAASTEALPPEPTEPTKPTEPTETTEPVEPEAEEKDAGPA